MPSKLIALIPLLWGAAELIMLLYCAPGLVSASLLVAAHTLACLCAGAGALRLMGAGAPRSTAPTSTAVSLGSALILGQGVLGALWQVLAALGGFTPALVITIAVACALPGLSPARALLLRALERVRSLAREVALDALGWRLVACLLVAMVPWTLVLAAHPPEGDALAFYLSQARLIAAARTLVPLPGYEDFASIGLASEMHFAVGFLFLGELAAKMMSWTCLLSLGLMLAGLAAQVGLTTRGRLVVVASLFSSSAVLSVTCSGKSDLFAAALGVAAVVWALEARAPGDEADGRRRALSIAGLLGGLAIAAKLSFAAVLPPLLALVASWRLLQRDAPAGQHALALARGAAVGTIAALAGLLPLMLKNWLVFGDPLELFTRRGLFNQEWFSPESTRWIVATYPLALVFGKYPMQDGNVSPLLLAFGPLGLTWLWRRARTALGVVTLSAALAVVLWVVMRPSILAPRYIFPPLLVGLVFGASVAERLASDGRSPAVRALVPWSVVATLVLLMVGLRDARDRGLRGQSQPESRFDATVGHTLGERLAPGDRWMIATFFSYGIDPDDLQCALKRADLAQVCAATDSQAVWAALHERGAKALLLDRVTHAGIFAALPDPQRTPPWLTVGETRLSESITIYWLEPGAGAPTPRFYCEQTRPGVWTVRDR